MTETTTKPTIDDPATTQVAAEYYVETEGGIPGLVVTLSLPRDLVPGADWIFDSVISADPAEGTITVLCYPNGDDEGWERLDEVGEW